MCLRCAVWGTGFGNSAEGGNRFCFQWLACLGIVVAVLLAGGGYYFFGRGKRQAPEQVQVVKEEQSVAVETKSVSEEKYKSVKVSSEECRRLTDKLEKSCIKTSFISILI